MQTKVAKLILVSVMMSLITNCGYNSTHDSAPGPLDGGPTGGPLDFAAVKAQVFAPFCLRCHSDAGGNRGGINLETFANVTGITGRIQQAVNTGLMPPSGPWEASASATLNAWIQAGAPETGTTPNCGDDDESCDKQNGQGPG